MDRLREHLTRVFDLSERDVDRLISEVWAFLEETPEAFVRRRHAELQREGLRNCRIFARIAAELPRRRFAAPVYTERQIRRLVYG